MNSLLRIDKYLILLFLFCVSAASVAQNAVSTGHDSEQRDWKNLDYATHKIYGTSTDKAFGELIGSRQPKKKVVVAVIDSGVDIEHEDLSGSIWTNADEIPENGLDDDHNGYVDDVHGWNFLVDAEGNDLVHTNLEATRVLRLSQEIRDTDGEIPAWLTDDVVDNALSIYNENVEEYKSMKQFAQLYVALDSMLVAETGKKDYTFDDIIAMEAQSKQMEEIKKVFTILSKLGITKADLVEMAETSDKFEQYYLNMDFNPREGFSPADGHYGNNHYEGEEADHGTHVAGIIAANRNNDLGARGIAYGSAELMVIRAVPDGDEDDRDVANAIRYAVDNGAQIINMSFGKGLSPDKALVDEAVQYAASRNVLLVHAAGNDSENNDVVDNFPNPFFTTGDRASTYITVGASSDQTNKELCASFSNYGHESVDLFAPGHEIYSTMPGDEYKSQSGTSMAAPVVSGVAALVWSYYPDLSVEQLKQVLLESSVKLPKKKVLLPGGKKGKEKVRFSKLSRTAGIVNTYEAMKLADEKAGGQVSNQ